MVFTHNGCHARKQHVSKSDDMQDHEEKVFCMNGALLKGMLMATALIRLDHHHFMSSVNQSAKTTSFRHAKPGKDR